MTSSSTPTLLHPSSTSSQSAQTAARQRNARSNHPRQSSGVFNAFSSKQIKGFKEAFNMLDQDSNSSLSRSDLSIVLANLGRPNDDKALDELMQSALKDGVKGKESINFTQFLTMFGEHLAELDEAPELLEAFECFDEKDDGVIDAGELRYWLSEVGDRMTDDEIDRLLAGPFMDRGGRNFDYKAFVEAVKMSEPAEIS